MNWQKQGIDYSKNIVGNNFGSRGYVAAHGTILLSKFLNQVNFVGGYTR